MFENNVMTNVVHYLCDPEKNTECSKTGCYINGGPCCFTSKKKYKSDKSIVAKNEIKEVEDKEGECDD